MITGLVSIKSLTEMITQLVGQGDALKDGADTGKEVKKLGAQATGVAVHGARIAGATAKSAAGVGKKVATSSAATSLRHGAANVARGAGGWVANKMPGHAGRVAERATKKANDDQYMQHINTAQDYQLRADKFRSLEKSLKKKGDMAGAQRAGNLAATNEKLYQSEKAQAQAMVSNGAVSGRAERKAVMASLSEAGKSLHFSAKLTASDASEKYLGNRSVKASLGFKDGIGVGAMLKGDKQKDTVINQVLHGNLVKNSEGKLERENFNISNTVTNANKYIFNITGAKGNLKDFLDNADVLDAIEESQNAMGKTLQKVLSQTGVKSDSSKSKKATEAQAKATANAIKKSMEGSNINSTMSSIEKQLEEIKKKLP